MPNEFIPRPWQIPMLEHLYAHKRCALWAGMGLGKTPVVLTWLESMITSGYEGKILIIGPLRVARSVWAKECIKWNHLCYLRVSPIIGTPAQRLKAATQDADIYTINYDNLNWIIDFWGASWPYDTVVADEASYLKGHRVSLRRSRKTGKEYYAGQGAKRSGALAKIAHIHISYFVELTGTPAPNGLADLWGQIWFLDRGSRLGTAYSGFIQRWFRTGFNGYGVLPLRHAETEIHARVQDICLALEGKDWFALDQPVVNRVQVELPQGARDLYTAMEMEMLISVKDRISSAANAAVRTQKCLQLANGAVYVDPETLHDDTAGAKWYGVHDEKIEALKSTINELAGASVIVCYEFKSDLERLLKAFPKGRVLRSSGAEEDFKQNRFQILFLHPKSGGHGIDGFQYVCNNMVFFGHNWSLEQHLQVIERIGPVRQMQAGLKRPVYLHYIVAMDTVDEMVMERREGKKSMQDILLEACARKQLSDQQEI